MLKATAVAILLLIPSHPANAFQVSCDDVRAYVAVHGRAKAIAFALSNGATFSDLRKAKQCLTTAKQPASSF